MTENCLFCGIVAGTIPSTQVASTDRAIAFMDINPATAGHLLVVPRVHSTDLREADAEDLIKLLDNLGEGYRRGRQPDGKAARQVATVLRGVADKLDV